MGNNTLERADSTHVFGLRYPDPRVGEVGLLGSGRQGRALRGLVRLGPGAGRDGIGAAVGRGYDIGPAARPAALPARRPLVLLHNAADAHCQQSGYTEHNQSLGRFFSFVIVRETDRRGN